MLKYIRAHPVARVTVAGGIGKITKLAQGRLDLHSKRGSVDLQALATVAAGLGAGDGVVQGIRGANTAAEAFAVAAGLGLGDAVAAQAVRVAAEVLDTLDSTMEVLIFDSNGALMGQAIHGRNLRR
jgi:cobalt-precorrin-5B (C1)-methyltransferase